MNALKELQRWYDSQCNGHWEHSYGVKIDTLDNPGWAVRIDLSATTLASRSFAEFRRDEGETKWLFCRVHNGQFLGDGGPLMLEDILQVFLDWAAATK